MANELPTGEDNPRRGTPAYVSASRPATFVYKPCQLHRKCCGEDDVEVSFAAPAPIEPPEEIQPIEPEDL